MPRWRTYLPRVLGVALVVLAGGATVAWIQNFLGQKPEVPRKMVRQITLVKPPPPPPPPPKVEQPPEPEIEEPVDVPEPEEPEPLPDAPDDPPAGDLGLDAEGAGAGDSFGLVGRKGGTGLVGGSGDPFLYYAGQLQRRIEEALAGDDHTRMRAYSIVARVWLHPDGGVSRVELKGSTGDPDVDGRLRKAILGIPPLAIAVPPGMPMPIRLRITSTL